jgi:hypothetical protein
MDWKTVKNEITEIYPFLAKARFGFKEATNHYPLPPLLAIGSYAAINVAGDDSASKRLAMIFPHSDSVACYVAAAASLAAIKKQFERGLPPLPDLLSGEKVLLDGVDYIYQGEEIIAGEPFMVFKYAGGGIQKVPASERLRVQHSVSSRQLTKRDKYPIKSVVDPILDTKLRGNTSLFHTSVILVSRIYEAREQVSGLSLAAENDVCSKLSNVFGWGSLTDEGEIKIWGSAGRREEPLVLVSSNFADVCEYVEVNSHKTDLIVVDGASYLKDLASFETLLNKNIPLIFVLSGKDQEGIQYLKRKDFAFWAWNSEDLKSLNQDSLEVEESPFYGLQKKIASFASFGVETVECRNSAFERAFDLLNRMRRKVPDVDYHATQILDRMFMFFLRVSRLVSITDSIAEKSEKELSSIESDLQTFRFNVYNFMESFAEIVESFKQGIALLSDEHSKPARLRSEVGKMLSASHEKICVVLSKSDFEIEKEYLATRFPGNEVVFERNASFKMRDDYDAVILCGYLKRNQMLRIFDEALSTKLTVLNYAHEKEWTSSVKKQFFGAFDKQDFRNRSVFGKKLSAAVAATAPQNSVEDTPATPALEEFEIKLNEFRRLRILKSINEDSGGQKVTARCITFNQGSFAFLTESYSMPVINELLGGKSKVEKIPQKKVKDILPGDFLLFRESGGRNLIREMADLGLSKKGKTELRNTASAWREALKKIYERENKSLSRVKNELKKYDCDRNELTIKNWLFDENQIAPGEDSDILAIAAAANDEKLLENYDDLIHAVRQVRGAHLQAAKQVAKLLERRVKGDLGELSESNAEIKVSGLGKVFIVCVESIDSALTEVPGHKANRLLKEKEREDGANDSAVSVG